MREATQFKPGQSGNPGGRARMPPEVRDRLRGPLTMAALDLIESLIQDKEAPAGARIAAASEVLNRAWGKVPIVDEDGQTMGGPVVIMIEGGADGV